MIYQCHLDQPIIGVPIYAHNVLKQFISLFSEKEKNQMTIVKCDRCGREIKKSKKEPVKDIIKVVYYPCYSDELADLCSECQKAVYDFIFKEGEKTDV